MCWLAAVQVASPKCVDALRVVLSPVKREEVAFFYDGGRADDDSQHPVAAAAAGSQTISHSVPAPNKSIAVSTSAVAVEKLSAPPVATSGVDKHGGQQCVYCASSFKSKSELERHVRATHVLPTTSQKCNICDEVFPSAAVLAEHKLTHCKVNAVNDLAAAARVPASQIRIKQRLEF